MVKLALLDDDANWCRTAEHFLGQEFGVVVFRSITSFFQELDRLSQFDVLIIDFSLPTARHERSDINGSEIITRIKQSLAHPPLLILATAFVSTKEADQLGRRICPDADAIFPKDAGLETLRQQIHQLLKHKAMFLLQNNQPQNGDSPDC
ncbi:DNA-binding transcriptional response regulator [Anthocerotibacter panamensis]|uniref:hypothetical protein n=1 Tax=Anthocerotibacter panamensis TaxID=2857077 RepID=UPI001C4068E2|nr:hypothetical protein [Anthocerotibacter panamensis]